MGLAVMFEVVGSELHLLYRPKDDEQWVHEKFDRNEDLVIKGTFHLTPAHLVQSAHNKNEDWISDNPLRFKIAIARGDYFKFDADIIRVGAPVLLHKDAKPTWKWFSSERSVSILDVIAQLKPERIVIGGPKPDAIPIPDYEKLVAQFPTPHELKRYTLARVASVVRDYMETLVDAEKLYRNYVEKRIERKARNFRAQFLQQDALKYRFLFEKLTQMLSEENSYPESVWQEQILQIILLLNPKYIKAVEAVRIPGEGAAHRFLDMLLIDASGTVDVIEIKKPFDKSIVTQAVYRNNHIPLRELSGSVMQVEKYLYRLSRWGHAGEKVLAARYANELPPGFQIRITNPSAVIIIGRDKNLTPAQRQDFEFVRRKYKSIADIITYDDLLRRLEYLVNQLAPAGRKIERGPRAKRWRAENPL